MPIFNQLTHCSSVSYFFLRKNSDIAILNINSNWNIIKIMKFQNDSDPTMTSTEQAAKTKLNLMLKSSHYEAFLNERYINKKNVQSGQKFHNLWLFSMMLITNNN